MDDNERTNRCRRLHDAAGSVMLTWGSCRSKCAHLPCRPGLQNAFQRSFCVRAGSGCERTVTQRGDVDQPDLAAPDGELKQGELAMPAHWRDNGLSGYKVNFINFYEEFFESITLDFILLLFPWYTTFTNFEQLESSSARAV